VRPPWWRWYPALDLKTVPKMRHFYFCWYLCWYFFNLKMKNLMFSIS
jgi:hypothetical protein